MRTRTKRTAEEKAIYWAGVKEERAKRRKIADANIKVWRTKDYSNYYVGKYNGNFELVDVFSNRNQAVREIYPEIVDYLKWNAGMQRCMLAGLKFKGHFYKYISKKSYKVTKSFTKDLCIPVTTVSKRGKVTNYESIIRCATSNKLDHCFVSGLLDTGKVWKGKLAFYKTNSITA